MIIADFKFTVVLKDANGGGYSTYANFFYITDKERSELNSELQHNSKFASWFE